MKTIYCVNIDWANNGAESAQTLACFESMEDAETYLNEYWESESEWDYFKDYDMWEIHPHHKEAWVDGYYLDKHICLTIDIVNLYSSEDKNLW